MLRTQVVKLVRATPLKSRSFSVVAARAAEGDAGAPPARGGGDSFQKREQAAEGLYIKEKEKEALAKLKKKMAEQQKHLDELNKNITELEGKSK